MKNRPQEDLLQYLLDYTGCWLDESDGLYSLYETKCTSKNKWGVIAETKNFEDVFVKLCQICYEKYVR